ncbi:MAG: DUF5343 domain-containing protein [Candidatus Thiodiazotropha sp. (ex Troendleina suluensis)]|nr:DUF5343 domain-containing protein [Candidatus Thiodiazotropha sp. (ex Troendleina suluensis)]
MALPDSYTQKPGSIPAYFDAILNAEAPERFTNKFLVNLEFKSTNDRLFIGILKDLGFIDTDGVPKQRYFEFHDKSRSRYILADAIREAYADLFTVNKEAHKLNVGDVKNKLRTLYAGTKKDPVINKIASTFVALCEYADFSTATKAPKKKEEGKSAESEKPKETSSISGATPIQKASVSLESLQYHINIVLPESRDQAVYDAIFKSLRDHLG